jgi:hypothetical protein
MARRREFLVVHYQIGSFPMVHSVHRDKELALEVSEGIAGGTGRVIETIFNDDPAISGGQEAAARSRAEQLEGENRSTFGRVQSPLDDVSEDERNRRDAEFKAAVEKRAAEMLEEADKKQKAAAKKTETEVRTTEAAPKAETRSASAPARSADARADSKSDKK